MRILNNHSDGLYLSSGLKQDAFGRTKMISLKEKSGIKATINNEDIFIEELKFEDTKISEDETVCFRFEGISGCTIEELLDDGDNAPSAEKIALREEAIKTSIRVLGKLISENSGFTSVGAGGILYSRNEASSFIYMLPSELFEQCARNNISEYQEIQGKWINKNLSGTESLIFTRSVLAYKSISSKMPFINTDTSKRQEDIFDENFLPLEKIVNGVDETLATAINSGLKIQPETEIFAGKRKIQDPKKAKKREELINQINSFSDAIFIEEFLKKERIPKFSVSEFYALQSAFIKTQEKKIFLKRFLRRNSRIIGVLAFVISLGFFAFLSFQKENEKLVSTKGLTSVETTKILYNFINSADVPDLQEIVKGKKTKDLIFKVSGFYVRSKERQGYDQGAGTISPAQWFFFKKESAYWMYGITNLKVADEYVQVKQDFPKRKDKRTPITAENGRKLKKGDRTVVNASYFLVHSDAMIISAEKINEEVTLEWSGNRWKVIDISGSSKPSNLKLKNFKEEYFAALEENEGNIDKTIDGLRKKYEWIPTEADLMNDARVLVEKYKSSAAENFILTKK